MALPHATPQLRIELANPVTCRQHSCKPEQHFYGGGHTELYTSLSYIHILCNHLVILTKYNFSIRHCRTLFSDHIMCNLLGESGIIRSLYPRRQYLESSTVIKLVFHLILPIRSMQRLWCR